MEREYKLVNRIFGYEYVLKGKITLEELAKSELRHLLKYGLYDDEFKLMDEGLVILYHVCRRIETNDKDDSIRVNKWN